MNLKRILLISLMVVTTPFIVQTIDANGNSVWVIQNADGNGGVLSFISNGIKRQVTIPTDGQLAMGNDLLGGLPNAGSAIIAQSYGINSSLLTTEHTCIDQIPFFAMVQVAVAGTSSGVKFMTTTQGNYVAASNNQVGLYSYNPLSGALTQIAVSVDNGNLWKDAAGTIHAEPFAVPVAVTPGIYFAAVLYHTSAETTAPRIAAAAATFGSRMSLMDLPNSGSTFGQKASTTTSLAASYSMATDVSPNTHRPWLALY